jgi:hypothetical protein
MVSRVVNVFTGAEGFGVRASSENVFSLVWLWDEKLLRLNRHVARAEIIIRGGTVGKCFAYAIAVTISKNALLPALG